MTSDGHDQSLEQGLDLFGQEDNGKSKAFNISNGFPPPLDGLSKKEYFAGLFFASIINKYGIDVPKTAVVAAVNYADDLLVKLVESS